MEYWSVGRIDSNLPTDSNYSLTPVLQSLGGFPWLHFATSLISAKIRTRLVDFYHRFLGTEELGRSAEGDISVTDGFYNLTFFKRRPELGEMQMDSGLHHIGLQVDDLEEVKGRFLDSIRAA